MLYPLLKKSISKLWITVINSKQPFALPLHSIFNAFPPPKQKCIGSGRAMGGPASLRAGRAPRLCEVRESQGFRWKWVRVKVSMSAQKETSRSDRAAPLCGAAGAGGGKARREATNSDGAEAAKRAVLSLFRIP